MNRPVTYLQVVSEDDLDLMMAWENNPEFWKYAVGEGPYSRLDVLNFIRECTSLEQHNQCRYVICRKGHDAVGALDLFDYDKVNKSAGIGILIANPADRRQGYAASAILQLLEDPATKRLLRLTWCLVHEDNLASRRLFESCGFRPHGEKLYKGKPAIRYIYYL